MNLKLYFDTTIKPINAPANDGFDRALSLLKSLGEKGVEWEMVDTSRLNAEQLMAAYFDCTLRPSICNKYRVSQVFGSRNRSGYLFGRGVPALVVYGWPTELPEDVYPHEERGRIFTIKEYLGSLLGRAQ